MLSVRINPSGDQRTGKPPSGIENGQLCKWHWGQQNLAAVITTQLNMQERHKRICRVMTFCKLRLQIGYTAYRRCNFSGCVALFCSERWEFIFRVHFFYPRLQDCAVERDTDPGVTLVQVHTWTGGNTAVPLEWGPKQPVWGQPVSGSPESTQLLFRLQEMILL